MQAEDTGGTGVSRPVPASRAVTRDQLHRQGPRARRGMHDRRSTGATAIKEDPGASRSQPYQPDADGIVRRAQRDVLTAVMQNDEPVNLADRIRSLPPRPCVR